jgi:hypothetical protein
VYCDYDGGYDLFIEILDLDTLETKRTFVHGNACDGIAKQLGNGKIVTSDYVNVFNELKLELSLPTRRHYSHDTMLELDDNRIVYETNARKFICVDTRDGTVTHLYDGLHAPYFVCFLQE